MSEDSFFSGMWRTSFFLPDLAPDLFESNGKKGVHFFEFLPVLASRDIAPQLLKSVADMLHGGALPKAWSTLEYVILR